MDKYRWPARCTFIAALGVFGLMLRGPSPFAAEQGKGPASKAEVFVYPEKLTAKDKLSFGGPIIPIKEETTLIYVDLGPGGRFAHPTQCVLISTKGARVIEGFWWLTLNGKPLFRDGKESKVSFPIGLSGK